MQQIKWFDRKFDFAFEQNIFPSILERLRDTPLRLEDKIRKTPDDYLRVKLDGAWSILENIGHLIDLEPLWQGRLTDILQGEKLLREADLENTQTNLANHNANSADNLLQSFQMLRERTVHLLDQITVEQVYQTALHPRLLQPMRTMDLFLFVAEHDDHHLAHMTYIAQQLKIKAK